MMVASNAFQCTDYRLGGQPMTDGVAAGALFAFFRNRTGAFARVAPVGVDLPERSH
jgi:hypothetical protein